jgi:hypothetical protein
MTFNRAVVWLVLCLATVGFTGVSPLSVQTSRGAGQGNGGGGGVGQGNGGSAGTAAISANEFLEQVLASRVDQESADDLSTKIGEAAKRKATTKELESLAKQREASLRKVSEAHAKALGTLWPEALKNAETAVSEALRMDVTALFTEATDSFGAINAALEKIALFEALPEGDVATLRADLSSLRRRINVALLQKVGANCPTGNEWAVITKWSSFATPQSRPSQDASPWAEARLRCVVRSIQPVCAAFQQALVNRDLAAVQRLYPESLAIQWDDFFRQWVIRAVRPPQDYKAESGTKASCVVPVTIMTAQNANPRGTAITSSIYHFLSLSADGDVWVITGMQQERRAY